jgi:Skp family chaperone for outer membrane proteins
MKTRLFVVALSLVASSSFAQQQPAKPAAKPATPPAPAAAPFPAGAKIAYVNIPLIVQSSAEGKADNAKVEALVKKKQAEAAALKTPTPQAQQQFQQQAEQEVQQLQAQLQADFQQKLMPVLTQIAQEKHLSMLISAQDAGVIWAEPGLDLTAEAIKRFDAAIATKR